MFILEQNFLTNINNFVYPGSTHSSGSDNDLNFWPGPGSEKQIPHSSDALIAVHALRLLITILNLRPILIGKRILINFANYWC